MHLFGGSAARNAADKLNARTTRVSSGWAALLKELSTEEGHRILDIGPTSSANINLLTGLGHSIYMADLLGDLTDPKWTLGEDGEFPLADFVAANLEFSTRRFDTVLLWDVGDYMMPTLRQAVVGRIHDVMEPGGKLLAFFHLKPETDLHRYHLRNDGQVEVQGLRATATVPPISNRQIEQLFHGFTGFRFFLAKDNLREVLVTR